MSTVVWRILAVGAALLVMVGIWGFVAVRGADSHADPPSGAGDPPPAGGGPLLPVGQRGGWELAFNDEFDGTTLDGSRWTDRSSAEADEGRGNKGNQQLEWNQAANCVVADGQLALTARREPVTAPSGERYDWTSCLISSAPSYAFQFGYVEERAILPAAKGFWPAFWTWHAADAGRPVETDVYEFHSDRHRELYLTQHSGAGGECRWTPKFDPTAGWHSYAAAIEPSGTTWYVDGVQVCQTAATSDGVTNIISNLAVFAEKPPAASTGTAVKRVDYIRAWQRR